MLMGDGPATGPSRFSDIGLGKAVFDESQDLECRMIPSQLNGADGGIDRQRRNIWHSGNRLAVHAGRTFVAISIRWVCVLYAGTYGQTPFPDKSVLNQVMRHATEPPKPLDGFSLARVKCRDGLQHVMNWMLAKDPAATLCDAVEGGAGDEPLVEERPRTPCRTGCLAGLSEVLEHGTTRRAADGTGDRQAVSSLGRLQTAGKKPRIENASAAQSDRRSPLWCEHRRRTRANHIAGTGERRNRTANRVVFFEFDRRDALMASIGGLLVVAAIIAGWEFRRH